MDQTDGIVLRAVDFSETSLILTIYTRDFGKISAIAKGGRRLKGPFESSLDLLCRVRLSVIQKKSDTLDILTESKLIWRFRPNSENYAGLQAGYVAAELVNEFTEPGDPNRELYRLLEKSLAYFETGNGVMRSLLRFEWALLEQLGQKPELHFCVECGNELDSDDAKERLFFAPIEGGIVCRECRTRLQNTMTPAMLLSVAARREIEKLSEPYDTPNENGPGERSVLGEVRKLTTLYFQNIAGRKIRIYDLLPIIAKNDRLS